MAMDHNPYNQNPNLLTLNQIAFRKIYTIDMIDAAVSDFRVKVKNYTHHKNISGSCEMVFRIMCCDKKSRKRKIYSRTVNKIRDYLDVNTIIKYLVEFQFLKSILFSRNVLEVFKSFSDLKTLKEDKIDEIHGCLRRVYEDKNVHDENNVLTGEEKVKDMDHYAVHFFIENFMKK
jgi:hypothetical protein